MRFRDREQAGEVLAGELWSEWKERHPIVLALPRGGVPVALPIARRLQAPLDLLLVRKLGAPRNPEYALGAIAEDGRVFLNSAAFEDSVPSQLELEVMSARAMREIKRQDQAFRGGRVALEVRGRSVILVDDGLATGSTMGAAIDSLRANGVRDITVALPVASREGMKLLANKNVEARVLFQPERFYSVGQWYDRFDPVTDQEVVDLLVRAQEVEVQLPGARLPGELARPVGAALGWILFAHGSGSSHLSPRNRRVARALNEAGFGTLLFDLLSPDESADRRNVFDIDLLARRLGQATDWLKARPEWNRRSPIGYFGASTGAAAALVACVLYHPDLLGVVSRGGRPDLASKHLARVRVPVLLIVGGDDPEVVELNERARVELPDARMEIIPGATHLFEEPGTLEQVIELTRKWLVRAAERSRKIA